MIQILLKVLNIIVILYNVNNIEYKNYLYLNYEF